VGIRAITGASPSEAIAAAALPQWPSGWYVVARAADVPPRKIASVELANRQCVIFRGETGSWVALDAHCPHMGAHLRHGTIAGDRIRCAMHDWHIGASADTAPGQVHCAWTRAWVVREQCGLLFLKLGQHGAEQPLGAEIVGNYVFAPPAVADLQTHWHGMMANAFDMGHLCAVHRRELVERAEVGPVDKHCFRLRYVARVTGSALSDRVMRMISNDRIECRLSCFGTTLLVETNLGGWSTIAVMGLLPTASGVRAYGAFGVQPGPFAAWRARVARWLFVEFLRRDFRVVEGMEINTAVNDSTLRALFDFWRRLPQSAL
jgi:phenylpropionate dioxygenase-like ring-hydroxylating dioxygenase large terminal subunit